MHIFRRLSCTVALLALTASLCYGRHYKLTVDSTDAVTKERVRVAAHRIGNHDFHDAFGGVNIERRGNKYYITFPLIIFSNPPYYLSDVTMPRGTKIIMQLDNGDTVESQTQQDIRAAWYFLWSYTELVLFRHGEEGGDGTFVKWPGGTKLLSIPENAYGLPHDDTYALEWPTKFEFTPADMLLLGKHKIVKAYSAKGKTPIKLPIKNRQAKRIKKSIAALVHK